MKKCSAQRAARSGWLSGAQGRNFDGSPRYPSRFVLDIDSDLLEFTGEPCEGRIADARAISFRAKLPPV